MVGAVLAAAVALFAFNACAPFLARDRARLSTMSRLMAHTTLAASILSPLAVVATYVAPSATASLNLRLYHLSAGHALTDAVPFDDRLFALFCASVPLAVAVSTLLMLRRLLLLFATGEIFSTRTSATLASLSLALFAFVIAAFLAEAPISYFLTRSSSAQAIVSLSVGLEDLIVLFAAAIAGIVSRVMSEATRIADENAEFV